VGISVGWLVAVGRLVAVALGAGIDVAVGCGTLAAGGLELCVVGLGEALQAVSMAATTSTQMLSLVRAARCDSLGFCCCNIPVAWRELVFVGRSV
jgi:hypothetical protein